MGEKRVSVSLATIELRPEGGGKPAEHPRAWRLLRRARLPDPPCPSRRGLHRRSFRERPAVAGWIFDLVLPLAIRVVGRRMQDARAAATRPPMMLVGVLDAHHQRMAEFARARRSKVGEIGLVAPSSAGALFGDDDRPVAKRQLSPVAPGPASARRNRRCRRATPPPPRRPRRRAPGRPWTTASSDSQACWRPDPTPRHRDPSSSMGLDTRPSCAAAAGWTPYTLESGRPRQRRPDACEGPDAVA
jgi:hypothetical protein